MNESTRTKISALRSSCRALFANYPDLPARERRLLAMAQIADKIKVREVGGNNRGPWVAAMLDTTDLESGYSWCAAALKFASLAADAPAPERPGFNPAAVIGWKRWLEARGGLRDNPERGFIAMHRTTATQGHIGIVVRSITPLLVQTIEGNTSPGPDGSQSDGGGLYRRIRPRRYWSWGFGDADA